MALTHLAKITKDLIPLPEGAASVLKSFAFILLGFNSPNHVIYGLMPMLWNARCFNSGICLFLPKSASVTEKEVLGTHHLLWKPDVQSVKEADASLSC